MQNGASRLLWAGKHRAQGSRARAHQAQLPTLSPGQQSQQAQVSRGLDAEGSSRPEPRCPRGYAAFPSEGPRGWVSSPRMPADAGPATGAPQNRETAPGAAPMPSLSSRAQGRGGAHSPGPPTRHLLPANPSPPLRPPLLPGCEITHCTCGDRHHWGTRPTARGPPAGERPAAGPTSAPHCRRGGREAALGTQRRRRAKFPPCGPPHIVESKGYSWGFQNAQGSDHPHLAGRPHSPPSELGLRGRPDWAGQAGHPGLLGDSHSAFLPSL